MKQMITVDEKFDSNLACSCKSCFIYVSHVEKSELRMGHVCLNWRGGMDCIYPAL